MDKVNYDSLDGFGVVLDDFLKDIQNVKDVLFGLMTAFGVTPEESFIISGCNWIPSTPPAVAQGWLCLSGEILPFVGAIPPTPGMGEIIYWDVQETVDTSGNRNSEEGIPLTPYLVRTAILVAGVAPAHYLEVIPQLSVLPPSPTLQSKIVAQMQSSGKFAGKIQEDWHVINSGGLEVPFEAGFGAVGGVNQLRYMKNSLGEVRLQGLFKATGTTTTFDKIIQLGAGYEGGSEERIDFVLYDVTADTWSRISYVNSGGLNGFYMQSPQNGHVYSVGSISYRSV